MKSFVQRIITDMIKITVRCNGSGEGAMHRPMCTLIRDRMTGLELVVEVARGRRVAVEWRRSTGYRVTAWSVVGFRLVWGPLQGDPSEDTECLRCN